MSTFALLLLCAQACLIQSVYGSCVRGGYPADRYAPGYAPMDRYAPGYAAGARYAGAAPPLAAGAYGGEDIGDIAIIGELPVSGTTALNGQVPIMGSVQFAGDVPAAGEVTIVGQCGYRPPYLANRGYY